LYLALRIHMHRSGSMAGYGNPYGVPSPDIAFPLQRYLREHPPTSGPAAPESEPQPAPVPLPEPAPKEPDEERRKRRITVYRAESVSPRQRVTIGMGGTVRIGGDDTRVLWLNFGQPARAEDFARTLIQRGKTNVVIRSFEVPLEFFELIKATSVRERDARKRENRGRPIESRDQPRGTQFGLREPQIVLLRAAIVQGTGREEPRPVP